MVETIAALMTITVIVGTAISAYYFGKGTAYKEMAELMQELDEGEADK